jgi:predicted NBD/HSP70 family sugar kinase
MDNTFLNKLKNIIKNPKAKQVFGEIRKHKKIIKIDLVKNTGLKSTTLTRILEDLLEEKLIIEAGYGFSTGGRKPILYAINPTYAYVIGLDLSRTYSKLVLCDLHLNIIDSIRWEMTKVMTPTILINHVSETVHKLLKENRVSKEDVLGMGVGSVGPLDRKKGIILEPLHFPAEGWLNIKICDVFEDNLQFPVKIDNGANTAILGEYWASEHIHYQQLVYIHIGVGIRSGMMSSGQVFYGATDMEGSIGQMIIQTDGLSPLHGINGNYGALESYTTIQAIENKGKSLLKQGRESFLNNLIAKPEELEINHFITALREKDPLVTEIIMEAATYLGIGLANILNILHPEKVILGGPLITNLNLYYETAVKVAQKKTYYYPTYQPSFAKSKLGESGLAIGAAAMMINQLYE